MYKVIRLLREAPHVFCFCITAVFLVCGFFNLRSSIESKDYIETTGEICNLKEREVMRHQRYETRYDYDVVWIAYFIGRHNLKKIGRIVIEH